MGKRNEQNPKRNRLMVKYNNILQIIGEYVEKCSNETIQTRLNKLSQDEKNEKLKTLTNPAEYEHYHKILKRIKECEDAIIDKEELFNQMDDETKEFFGGEEWLENGREFYNLQIQRLEKDLFHYEKRIIQGHKPRQPKEVSYDLSNYSEDKQFDDVELSDFEPHIGKAQRNQIRAQENINFTKDETNGLSSYFNDGFEELNKKLWSDGRKEPARTFSEINKGNDLLEQKINNLSSAIQKTSLEDDTIVYHGGHFDISQVVGDEVLFKGFTSCSYQKSIANNFSDDTSEEVGFVYRIALPKGSQGLCANAKINSKELSSYRHENELLLDKGFKGRIAEIDYENHMVTIVPI